MCPVSGRWWLRFSKARGDLERQFIEEFDSRQVSSDLVFSLTLTLCTTVFALRARRSGIGAGAGLAAVGAAALPLLLLLRWRDSYVAWRRWAFLAYAPALWEVASTVATAALAHSPGPLNELAYFGAAAMSTLFPLWSSLLLRLPFRHHVLAHGLGQAVNIRHNVQRVQMGLPHSAQASCAALAGAMRRAASPSALLALLDPLGGAAGTGGAAGGLAAAADGFTACGAALAGQPCCGAALQPCLANFAWMEMAAAAAGACACWLLELRQRRAFAARRCPDAL
eukprot:scaffold15.g4336.t1